jgi:regulation of enolase protein 1 (concanavalin A-like superfamily)
VSLTKSLFTIYGIITLIQSDYFRIGIEFDQGLALLSEVLLGVGSDFGSVFCALELIPKANVKK